MANILRILKCICSGVYKLFILLVAGICYVLFHMLDGDEDIDGNNKPNVTSQNDRSSDDIWKLSSGNDYYKNDPPEPFK